MCVVTVVYVHLLTECMPLMANMLRSPLKILYMCVVESSLLCDWAQTQRAGSSDLWNECVSVYVCVWNIKLYI